MSARVPMIIKANGAREKLSMAKLEKSIRRVGATAAESRRIARTVVERMVDGMTTAQIRKLVQRELSSRNNRDASVRYSLKNAMQRLGPAGYHFENYVAAVLRGHGYDAFLPDVLPGMAIAQEVDVIATKGKELAMVECKYRNRAGIYVHLKDVMATWARYDDLLESHRKGKHKYAFNACWVVCNTKVTADGVAFGEYKGMRIVGWRHPKVGGLERLIEERRLFPVTILRTVPQSMFDQLAGAGIMLCSDLLEASAHALSRLAGLPIDRIERMQREAVEVLRQ